MNESFKYVTDGKDFLGYGLFVSFVKQVYVIQFLTKNEKSTFFGFPPFIFHLVDFPFP